LALSRSSSGYSLAGDDELAEIKRKREEELKAISSAVRRTIVDFEFRAEESKIEDVFFFFFFHKK